MAELGAKSLEAASRNSVGSFLDVAWTNASPRLYLDNPFRVLGLSSLAPLRDLAKRLDELRLASELGLGSYDWAFAPNPPPTQEQVRAAAQRLGDPRQRFVAELFWFWPDSYPEKSEDPAIDELMRNVPGDAVNIWASQSTEEHPAALHNLAVYHHMMAIELEQSLPPLPPEDIAAWWRAALAYWRAALANDAIWRALERRVVDIADAQLPREGVASLRRHFWEIISSVNGALAVRWAEAGDAALAARHVALLGDIHEDVANVRRALQRAITPVTRRIDTRLAECQRSASNPNQGLTAARVLVEHCVADLRVIETVCGREADLTVEMCSRVAITALDAIVAYQHATGNNTACLGTLIYLQTLPMNPETARRVRDSFETVFTNAAEAEPGKPEADEPQYARWFRVVAENLIPDLETLEVGAAAHFAAYERVADLLRRVAQGACDERDDIAFALHAYTTLLRLPGAQGDAARREAERDEFQARFQQRLQKELRLPLPEHALEVTVRGVRWDDRAFAPNEITGLRYSKGGGDAIAAAPAAYVIAWRAGETEITLDASNVFTDPATAAELFARICEAMDYFIVPHVGERVASAVRGGEPFQIGGAELTAAGFLVSTGTRFWKREEALPYATLACQREGDQWLVRSSENPKVQKRYSALDTWNAPALGYVIDALARS